MSGFFLLRRAAIDPDQLHPDGYKVLLEILVRTPELRVAEVGFQFDVRHGGESKASPADGVSYLRHVAELRPAPARRHASACTATTSTASSPSSPRACCPSSSGSGCRRSRQPADIRCASHRSPDGHAEASISSRARRTCATGARLQPWASPPTSASTDGRIEVDGHAVCRPLAARALHQPGRAYPAVDVRGAGLRARPTARASPTATTPTSSRPAPTPARRPRCSSCSTRTRWRSSPTTSRRVAERRGAPYPKPLTISAAHPARGEAARLGRRERFYLPLQSRLHSPLGPAVRLPAHPTGCPWPPSTPWSS